MIRNQVENQQINQERNGFFIVGKPKVVIYSIIMRKSMKVLNL